MKPFAWILSLVAFCIGCDLIENGTKTLVTEPSQYCASQDEHRESTRHERSAQDAWIEYGKCNPGQVFSHDFALGFVDGYAGYLDAGGTCEPPPIPPRWYWAERANRQGSVDWLLGYRTGAHLACQTGQRASIVVPTGACVNQGFVPVYVAPCQQPMLPIEAVPPPSIPFSAPANEEVPHPAPMPAAPNPQTMSPQTLLPPGNVGPQEALLTPAYYPPQQPVTAPATPVNPLRDTADGSALLPSAFYLDGSGAAFSDEVDPSFPNILGCSHESR